MPTDAAILGYKNTFGGNGGCGILEDNLEVFKAQIDMKIVSDLGEYAGASGKFEFQYEDENEGVNYKFCIFKPTIQGRDSLA